MAKKTAAEVKTWDSGNRVYTAKDAEAAEKTATMLSEAFVWDDTKEGGEFWSDIHNRLNEIGDTIRQRLGTDGLKF